MINNAKLEVQRSKATLNSLYKYKYDVNSQDLNSAATLNNTMANSYSAMPTNNNYGGGGGGGSRNLSPL